MNGTGITNSQIQSLNYIKNSNCNGTGITNSQIQSLNYIKNTNCNVVSAH